MSDHLIVLIAGRQVLIDTADIAYLSARRWHIMTGKYPYVVSRNNTAGRTLLLHRLIMNAPEQLQVDHLNHNVLDNRRQNLRLVTLQQNGQNLLLQRSSTTGYRGVCYATGIQRYIVSVGCSGRSAAFGSYASAEEADRVACLARSVLQSGSMEAMGLSDSERQVRARSLLSRLASLKQTGRRGWVVQHLQTIAKSDV